MPTPTPPPVFISYARRTSRAHAEALHQALGGEGGLAFLDTSGLEQGEHWPATLRDAMWAARVVVLFAEDGYFQRLYCCRELRFALAPFLAAQKHPGLSEAQRREALAPLVVARPVAGSSGLALLPPQLRDTQWPRADETALLAALVRSRLDAAGATLGERLEALGASRSRTAAQVVEELALEPPAPLEVTQPLYPVSLPSSLGTAFVGRADELWGIDFALRAQAPLGNPRIAALQGGGGTGKTRLALEYLHRYGRHYPGGVFWIDADAGEERLEEQLHGVLQTLRPDTPPLHVFRKEQRNLSTALAQSLREASARPVLYVVDNLPEPSGTQRPRPLRDFCPGPVHVSLLVTSRLRITEPGVVPLRVEPLAPESSRVLLTHDVTEHALGPQEWGRVTHWVGHLPLALELLNSALRLGAIDSRELLEKALHERPAPELDRQMDALRDQVPRDSLRGVTEAFSLSYERLLEEVRKAARLVAWLAPEPIPMALLEALGPEASEAKLRTALVARSFITPIPGRDIPLFGRMHRLLADFLRGQSPEPAAELRHVGKAALEMVPPEACRDSAAWPMLQLWFPHAESLHASLRQQGTPRDASLEANLGLLMGSYLAERGALTQARDLGWEVLERVQDTLGPEHPDTLVAVNNLALTYRQLGDNASAIAYGERLVEVSRRVMGAAHPSTLTAMGNLAGALQDEGFLVRARELKEEVLEGKMWLLGPKHPETLVAMSNLARLLAEEEEFEEALELEEKCLQFSEEVLGPAHPDTLLAMGSLANILRSLDRLDEARALQERVLTAFLGTHGLHHPKTLVLQSELAATLSDKGDHAEARRLQEEVLAIRSKESGEGHPATILSMQNLAKILKRGGELQRACVLQRDALERCRRTFGEGHRETHTALNELAGTLRELGVEQEAHALEEELLRSGQQHLGEDHPGTLSAMSQLAAVHHAKGELHPARELGHKALQAWVRTRGNEDDMTTLAAWSHLQVLRDLGDSMACEAILSRHLQWLLERAPENLHPIQQGIRNELLKERGAHGSNPETDDPVVAKLVHEVEELRATPGKADLLLHVSGTPVESDEAYEQIRSFLLGKLLSRGIHKGEAVAMVERRRKEYRVQFLLWQDHGPESLGSITVPLQGHGAKAFSAALKKAGITRLEDPSVRAVAIKSFDPGEE
ncbi:MAG TPA: toll/interleukin-1 receptor domain-containing protein [Archangium sp.]|uniref:tetratricopeptide repeat protein n=1 Tax=Archangium sp. TaxID=1872627 RepID=UPI002E366577|nr:toll/interleukin-1 receptor domain-containing protein [Archangium sp.]HEX5748067.1 toll/interleukin-1 receptor domain-containing protein [Archangium sp.]